MKANLRMALVAIAVSGLCTTAIAEKSGNMTKKVDSKSPAKLVNHGRALPLKEALALSQRKMELDAKAKAQQTGRTIRAAEQHFEIPNQLMPLQQEGKRLNADPDAINLKKKLIPSAISKKVPSPTVDMSFLGYSQTDNAAVGVGGVSPPDTNGDVGQDYYVQYVNLGWIVLNKSDGTVAAGPFIGNSFWQGFGGVCETNNAGDPIVLYDHLADRWVFSQFTSPSNTDGHQCFAVSQGPDLVDDINNGNFALYDFIVSPGAFNDYEKITVWPDGYYMSHNEFQGSFVGVGITWFDRDAMLDGFIASSQRVFLPSPPGGSGQRTLFNLEPANLEGFDLPPAGTCNYFVMANDWELWNNGGAEQDDAYLVYEYCVDPDNEDESTFTQVASISAPEFNSSCQSGGFASTCAQQPGTGNQLDTLPQMTMYRFNTRMINDQLVGAIAHNVNDGNDVITVRWAKLGLDTSGTNNHTLLDTGNVDTSDGQFRWMGSAGMDQDGNLAVVYSRSGSEAGQFPSVAFSARLAADAAGTIRDESLCVQGSGSQTGSSRWGDYSSMSIDPIDQCTFWMTAEYVETTGSVSWNNRVCSFKFDECGEPGFFITGDNLTQDVCTASDGSLAPINLTVGQVQGFSSPVSLSLAGPPTGVSGSFSVNPVIPAGNSILTVNYAGGLTTGAYQFDAVGTASGADSRNVTVSLNAFATAPDTPTLDAPGDNSAGIGLNPAFSWNAAAGAQTYVIEIATDASFTNIVESATVSGTEYTSAGLVGNTRYFWRVTGSNVCGDAGFSATFSFITSELFCAVPALPIDVVGQPIPSSIIIDEPGQLNDLNALINLNHTWVGDLLITLQHVETGTTISLIDRPGRTDTGFGCSGDNINNIFDDAGNLSAEDGCTSGSDAYSTDAILIPNGLLSDFNGEDLTGEWTLTITDNAAGDTGILNEWCLIPDASVPGDFNDDGCIDVDDMALLLAEIRARTNNPTFDLNGDGVVNSRDRRVMTASYTNPRGARCN